MKRRKAQINQGPNPTVFWCKKLAKEKRQKRDHNHGFSLIELIIVIAILAILAATIAPALIRYIDKSRKAIDIENAEVIYKAAEMAATNGSDEANAGWGWAAKYKYNGSNTDVQGNTLAYTKVTSEGHNSSFDSSGNYYYINCVAWARGINYKSAGKTKDWENARYKCTANGNTPDENNLRTYTNEFLACLLQEEAKDATYLGNGNNTYDGFSAETIPFRFKKDLGHGAPEIWMVCVNCASMTPEIWIGEKNINGRGAPRNIRPLYRIYPDPCEEYRE